MLLNKVFRLFDARDRLHLLYLALLSFLAALSEIFCISLLIPLGNLIASNESSAAMFKLLGSEISFNPIEYLVVLFGAFLIKNIFMYYLAHTQSRFTYLQQEKISNKIFENFIGLPYAKLKIVNPSEVARGIAHDVTQYVQTVIQPLIGLFADLLVGISLIAYLIVASDVENLGATFSIVISLFFLSYMLFRWNKNFLRESGAQRQKLEGERISLIYGAFGSIKELIIYKEAGYFFEKIRHINSEISRIMYKITMIQSSPKLILEQFLVFGIILIAIKKISIGYVTAFIAAAFRFSVLLNRSLQNLQHLRHANKSIEYISYGLSLAPSSAEATQDTSLQEFKTLKFRAVKFGHNDISIFTNLNLEINQYDYVAIVGESGSGKSTFLSLLLGLYEPQNGEILINDIPIKQVCGKWHDWVSYVPQDAFIMDDSIFVNVAYGSDQKSISEHGSRVIKALELAEINDEVLSGNIDKRVTTSSISGGQRQRIALARALYRDRQVLVLDEFTSALDQTITEKILQNLNTLKGKKTVIMVTHNRALLRICNKIIDIDKIHSL